MRASSRRHAAKRAHSESLSSDDVDRHLDTAARLCHNINACEPDDAIRALGEELQQTPPCSLTDLQDQDSDVTPDGLPSVCDDQGPSDSIPSSGGTREDNPRHPLC